MPIGNDTFATRRHLPHLQKHDKTYFVTFATRDRWILPPHARTIVLECYVRDHGLTYWLHTAVVMPDHVHMLFTPYETWTRSDERIREDVCERLTMDHDVDASEIDVTVTEGVVTLSGSVNERHAKRIAEDICESVRGVKDVQNNLRVMR